MNPAERQTAEGILFTAAYGQDLPHPCLLMNPHKKATRIDCFLRSRRNGDRREHAGARLVTSHRCHNSMHKRPWPSKRQLIGPACRAAG